MPNVQGLHIKLRGVPEACNLWMVFLEDGSHAFDHLGL